MSPTEELIKELCDLGCDHVRALGLVAAAAMQWAVAPRARSRHAEAQAKHWAKKQAGKAANGSYLIISDHSDQGQKESPQTPKEKTTPSLSVNSLRSLTGAEAPTEKAILYNKGLKILSKITGNTDASLRSLLGRWSKMVDGDYVHVLAAIEDAEREEPVDPRGWIFGRLRAIADKRPQFSAKPLSAYEQRLKNNKETIHATFAAISDGTLVIERYDPLAEYRQPANSQPLVASIDPPVRQPGDHGDNPGLFGRHGGDLYGIPGKGSF